MGNWSYNPTYRSYNTIYNWKGAHLVGFSSENALSIFLKGNISDFFFTTIGRK